MARDATGARRVDWPNGFVRTLPEQREPNNSFRVTLSTALDELENEFERLGADSHHFSTAMPQRKTDSRPYANATHPDDPGVAAYWVMDGEQYAVACDEFTRVRDNARSIGLYIREKRKMQSRPVVTGRPEFSNARLPSGDDGDPAEAFDRPDHEIVGVDPDASEKEIRRSARAEIKAAHPDTAGTSEYEVVRVKSARDRLLGDDTEG